MLAKEIEVVALGAAEALVLYVLLVLLVQLLLLRHRAGEMCEGVGEVVTGKATPVRRHRVRAVCLLLGSLFAIQVSLPVSARKASKKDLDTQD